MKDIMNSIRNEVSKKRLYASVKEVSNFHRIQASTGFREAAQFVCKKLVDEGIAARVLPFVADDKTWYLQQKMFMEWDCKDAWLELEDTHERIADFREEAMSIVQKSYPCDYSNEPLDIVLVENFDVEYLDTLDLKGKLVFIHEMPKPHLQTLIKKRGAVGFITDFMREVAVVRARNDAYDTLNYTSFWWKHTKDEPKTFGFVLSPRVGDQLKKLCLEKEAAYQKDHSLPRYPRATCKVESSLYPGEMEVVEAVLPGETEEEIMLCAHLCHPKASANDNASGVAGGMEAIRVLKRLSESGKIPALKKTIRLILVPEMTGTYCYLSTLDHYDHIKGAINMDMIGGKQDGTYGPITITATHHAIKSPITSIASMVLKYNRQQAPAFMGGPVPLVNSIIAGYSGGSDHTIFSDTSINIPCIMLGQWPDKYYHTSSDTLECVDPNVLAFSTSFAAGFVYALSNFDEKMHQETLLHHTRLMIKDLEEAKNKSEAKHLIKYYKKSIKNLKQYGDVDVDDDKDMIKKVGKSVMKYLDLEDEMEFEEKEEYNYVPTRLFVGPVNDIVDYKSVSRKAKKAVEEYEEVAHKYGFAGMMATSYVLNYMNGERSLNDIYQEVLCECGKADIELMDAYCKVLEKLGLVKIKMEEKEDDCD